MKSESSRAGDLNGLPTSAAVCCPPSLGQSAPQPWPVPADGPPCGAPLPLWFPALLCSAAPVSASHPLPSHRLHSLRCLRLSLAFPRPAPAWLHLSTSPPVPVHPSYPGSCPSLSSAGLGGTRGIRSISK